MIKRVYIDNSVIGGVFDEEFSFFTKKFFGEIAKGLYTPVISTITIEEIAGAPQFVLDFFNKLRYSAEIVTVSEDVIELSKAYAREGHFSKNMLVDTLHIAAATVHHIELITSWNFKHIVNLDKIRIYNSVNLKFGYPFIEIRTPREILHE